MKNTLSIITLTLGLGVCAPQAQAGDEGWAAFGGLLGGAVLTHAAYQSHGHHAAPSHGSSHRESSGHFEYREERVWVPGHYDYERDACGHKVRVFHPGHYKSETVKVWIPHRRGHYASRRSCGY
ncbi:MAG: hypothetical protein ACI9TH_004866 [Kiritimatiellia bacterium]|jgi:hypothetical protein